MYEGLVCFLSESVLQCIPVFTSDTLEIWKGQPFLQHARDIRITAPIIAGTPI